jgi:hypothetical protein
LVKQDIITLAGQGGKFDLKEAARRQQAYGKSQDVTADGCLLITSEKKMASQNRRPSSQILDFVGAGARNRP